MSFRFVVVHQVMEGGGPWEAKGHKDGAFLSFEGRIRVNNQKKEVQQLEYECQESMACKEGERVLEEARDRFAITWALCRHRMGVLVPGELAMHVLVSAPHRKQALEAMDYIIDEIKSRVPIWKKEVYTDQSSAWLDR